MNIFVLDLEPAEAAAYHCDKHVIKMILETAQMLCTAHHFFAHQAPYRPTHQNHPCSVWVRNGAENYRWTCDLGMALCSEYERRYQKQHKTESVLQWCREHIPSELPDVSLTPFAQAMPAQYRRADAVEAYRDFYIHEKSQFATWRHSQTPFWWPAHNRAFRA